MRSQCVGVDCDRVWRAPVRTAAGVEEAEWCNGHTAHPGRGQRSGLVASLVGNL